MTIHRLGIPKYFTDGLADGRPVNFDFSFDFTDSWSNWGERGWRKLNSKRSRRSGIANTAAPLHGETSYGTNFWYFILMIFREFTFFLSWTRSSHENAGFEQTSPRSCPTSCLSSKISPAQPLFSRPNNQIFYQVAARPLQVLLYWKSPGSPGRARVPRR
jgi:hypothetical protein